MQASSVPVRQRLAATAVAAAAAAACATLLLFDPNEPGYYPTCPFLAATGRWCPGCGSLRGMRALLTGDLAAAVGFNALMVASLPYLIYRWAIWFQPRWSLGAAPGVVPMWAMYTLPVAVAAFWVLRNIAVWPFTALAP